MNFSRLTLWILMSETTAMNSQFLCQDRKSKLRVEVAGKSSQFAKELSNCPRIHPPFYFNPVGELAPTWCESKSGSEGKRQKRKIYLQPQFGGETWWRFLRKLATYLKPRTADTRPFLLSLRQQGRSTQPIPLVIFCTQEFPADPLQMPR